MTQQIQHLVQKFFRHECTPEERSELLGWVAASENDIELRNILEEAWKQFVPLEKMEENKAEDILKSIIPDEQYTNPVIVPVKYLWTKRIAVASAVILLVSTATYYQFFNKQKPGIASVSKTPVPASNEAFTGKNRATLTLSDGSLIMLEPSLKGTISRQGNTQVVSRGGEIFYSNTNDNAGTTLYNTLNTQRGEAFPLNLSDGSRVWLNAASSIRYPVAFQNAERVVDVTGEAYFEVARNPAKPFRVRSKGMEIEVLGTHFNINAYTDESTINTTLLEGSLRVSKGTASVLLSPGQQTRLQMDGRIELVKEADTEQAVSWKEGYFHFINASLETVMRQFSRWYDVDVAYESKQRFQTFSGDFEKSLTLSQALKILEKSQVRCRIEGKKIIVSGETK